MVTIEVPNGGKRYITDKLGIEKAIMQANEKKFRQSTNCPFYKDPLVSDFGFKAISSSAAAVLAGVYESSTEIPTSELCLLSGLEIHESVRDLLPIQMDLTYEEYMRFWKTAKENTSSYPDALSFSTMKAGTFSPVISQIEWQLTKIPLQSGYSPSRWRRFMDVMILKKSGITLLDSLRTVVLFSIDCNYAFKHVGRRMMSTAEQAKALAQEQYGSQKGIKLQIWRLTKHSPTIFLDS
jgi:hypothetical protein